MIEKPAKLLLDEMLAGMARWLRAAGYDTTIADRGAPDAEIIRQAENERRKLITRDQKMMEHKKARDIALLLVCDGLEECAEDLTRKAQIDWHLKPLSRCMECNTQIEPAAPELRKRLPDKGVDKNAPIFYCPNCDKVYWQGSHVRRIQQRLDRWAKRQFHSD